MVQALGQRRKRKTRRIVKGLQNPSDKFVTMMTKRRLWDSSKETAPGPLGTFAVFVNEQGEEYTVKSKYQKGDILWVRERFCLAKPYGDDTFYFEYVLGDYSKYPASSKFNNAISDVWKPSIHMPKEAARIFLEVTNVRVERVQDICEEDAISEGVYIDIKTTSCTNESGKAYTVTGFPHFDSAQDAFKDLWEEINGKQSWNENPYVWVYEFKQIEKTAKF